MTTTVMPLEGDEQDLVWLRDGRLNDASGSSEENQNCPTIGRFNSMRAPQRRSKNQSASRIGLASGWTRPTATADGKRLVFREHAQHRTVYVAEMDSSAKRLLNLRSLTMNEGTEWPGSLDCRRKVAVIFTSDRSGRFGIYQQPLDGGTPKPIITAPQNLMFNAVTPDGVWILYVVPPKQRDGVPFRLMRVRITGGSPEFVMESPRSGVLCSRPPATGCVLFEGDVLTSARLGGLARRHRAGISGRQSGAGLHLRPCKRCLDCRRPAFQQCGSARWIVRSSGEARSARDHSRSEVRQVNAGLS